jgi:hypothetical protein
LIDFEVSLAMHKPLGQPSPGFVRIQPDRTFPDNRNLPVVGYQAVDHEQVTTPILAKLFVPEQCSRLGETEVRAIDMPVPEAAVHKHDLAPFRQHQVRPTRQVPRAQPVPETGTP